MSDLQKYSIGVGFDMAVRKIKQFKLASQKMNKMNLNAMKTSTAQFKTMIAAEGKAMQHIRRK